MLYGLMLISFLLILLFIFFVHVAPVIGVFLGLLGLSPRSGPIVRSPKTQSVATWLILLSAVLMLTGLLWVPIKGTPGPWSNEESNWQFYEGGKISYIVVFTFLIYFLVLFLVYKRILKKAVQAKIYKRAAIYIFLILLVGLSANLIGVGLW